MCTRGLGGEVNKLTRGDILRIYWDILRIYWDILRILLGYTCYTFVGTNDVPQLCPVCTRGLGGEVNELTRGASSHKINSG